MMNSRFMGWGSIGIGVVLLCPGLVELASGAFFPRANRGISRFVAALDIVFGSFAPYVSALLWFVLAALFIWMGIQVLRQSTDKQEVPDEPVG
jgi:threonine/homoserine/homoserine lactone efflux protein